MGGVFVRERLFAGCFALLLSCGLVAPAGAEEPVDALKKQLQAMQEEEMGRLMMLILMIKSAFARA